MGKAPTTVILNGKPVSLSLNIGRKMRGKANGCDLGNLEDGPIHNMFLDPEVLAETVWTIFEDRIVAAGIDNAEDFYEMLEAKLLKEVEAAMKASIVDFFSWGEKLISLVEKKLSDLGTNVDPSDQYGLPYGSSPESLESTPGSSLTEN